MDRKGHLARLVRAVGGEEVVEALIRLSPRDLQSLLMHVLAERAEGIRPLDLVAQLERAPVFAPGFVDPRVALDFARAAFAAASEFEAVELSPASPLGGAHALGGVHLNNVLSTTRGAEVVADPTVPLALLAALRRRSPLVRLRPLRLCALQRVVRMQPPPMPGLLPHFRVFALLTAEQRGGEELSLRQHIEVYLRLFRLLGERGYRFDAIEVAVSDTAAVEHRLGAEVLAAVRREVRTLHGIDADVLAARYGLAPLRGPAHEVLAAARLPAPIRGRLERIGADVLAPLAAAYPEAQLGLDLTRLEGLGYYSGPCLRIRARPPGEPFIGVVDGGFLPWGRDLLSDRREQLLSTGIGADLICAAYRGPSSHGPGPHSGGGGEP